MNRLSAYWQSLRTPDAYFNISYALMMFMMALLPFTVFFMWPIGVALMVLWVCQWNWREKWKNFKENNGIPYGFFLLGIFLIPILGFIKSENMPIAWRSFECHIWFLFTPLVFLTTSPKLWTKNHFKTLLVLFSISEVLLLLFFLIRGIYYVIDTGDFGYMYNDRFCYSYHHAYVALYATFVYILVFYFLTENSHRIPIKRKIPFYAMELLIAICIFFLYSRAGILIFLFMHLLWSGYAIYRNPSKYKPIIGIVIIVFALFGFLMVKSPTNRFTAYNMSLEDNIDNDETDPRLVIWQATLIGIKENIPWGVGTGDGNDVIEEKYREKGHWLDIDYSLNAHNQFLFALLTNGIPGLIILLLYFYAPLGLAVKYRDSLLLSVFLLMFLNCLVECMFDRRAGVDFFAIMIPLLLLRCKNLSMSSKV